MDESVINGANLFFAPQFGLDTHSGDVNRNQWLLGLVNSAPYVSKTLLVVCCAPNLFALSSVVLSLAVG